jgi:4-amino-4-deoxy-L-arabinose transferase-like glycosyltransferase
MYHEHNNHRHIKQKFIVWLVVLGILAGYAILTIPTLGRLGIGWDEASDIAIAQAYQTPQGILLGHPWDPSQTRLPMFIVALVFRLFGTSDLILARMTTVFVGGLTLLEIFLYGKNHFNSVTGLLAAGLLAINPFFLSFARLAFTEGDVYLACTLTWLLVAISRFQEKSSIGNAMLSGIFFGLSISAKATAIFIIPARFVAIINHNTADRTAARSWTNNVNSVSTLSVCIWAVWVMVTLVIGVLINKQLDDNESPGMLRFINYLVVWLSWVVTFGWAVRHRNRFTNPFALFVFIVSFGILTFAIFPPEHLGNYEIINSLISRVENEMVFSSAFFMEIAMTHLFTLLLKPTPIIGLGLVAGFVVSLAQWRRPELTLPLTIIATYMLGILLLTLSQTFYTIPILPILSLLTAAQLQRLHAQRRKLSVALIVLGIGWWNVEMKQSYPDYHLNGYQWLEERSFFGKSSIGYRSIVYTPSDGVQQAMEWLNMHARPGQVAQLYVGPWHIVNSIAPDPIYEISDGREETLDVKPDFVVIHIGETISQGVGNESPQENIFRYPFDPDALYRDYEKVFVVRRAFDLEMASVWMRK